jgi:hypothetical protein
MYFRDEHTGFKLLTHQSNEQVLAKPELLPKALYISW